MQSFRRASGQKADPAAKATGLREIDILNFKILMSRLAGEDGAWKSLLVRRWASLSQLLDAGQDHIQGKHRRRLYRRTIDELWTPTARG